MWLDNYLGTEEQVIEENSLNEPNIINNIDQIINLFQHFFYLMEAFGRRLLFFCGDPNLVESSSPITLGCAALVRQSLNLW